MPNLKPCPFCGNKVIDSSPGQIYYYCPACDASGSSHALPAGALKNWNNRLAEKALVEALKAVVFFPIQHLDSHSNTIWNNFMKTIDQCRAALSLAEGGEEEKP